MAKKQRKITIRYEITDGKIRFFDKDNNELSYENTVKGILDCPHIILQPSSSLPPIANKGVFNVHFINQFNGLKSRNNMTKKQWDIATHYEVTNGRIQLFDKDNNKLPGEDSEKIDFHCPHMVLQEMPPRTKKEKSVFQTYDGFVFKWFFDGSIKKQGN